MANSVGIVLVSHSRVLAEAAAALANQMAGGAARVEIAAGAGDDHRDFGTDATEIMAAIEFLDSPAGTLVLMDLGSAILSAETALDLIDPGLRERVDLCAAPFVEGALAAATAAAAGAQLAAVRDEALGALEPKRAQLGEGGGSTAVSPAVPGDPSAESLERTVAIGDPAGLHLRPAAAIVRVLREFDVTATLISHDKPDRRATGASLTSMLGLGLRAGSAVRVIVDGASAGPAISAIERILAADTPAPSAHTPTEAPSVGPSPASPGIAIGRALTLRAELPQLARRKAPSAAEQRAVLGAALSRARAGVEPTVHPILAAQRDLLDDPALEKAALALIDSEGLEAAVAWYETIRAAATTLEGLDDPILRARAVDLCDVGIRVLEALGIQCTKSLPEGPPVILIAEDLPPSRVMTFDPERVVGVIDRAGGPTTHAAILLRARGIPAVVGVSDLGDIPNGIELAIDGTEGKIWREPDAETRALLEVERDAERRAALDVSGEVVRHDGTQIELWANVASPEESEAAMHADARGIGLLRTEFLFLDRREEPSEDEQTARLAAILAPMRGRPVHVRTLDAGADKPVPFLPLGEEANPYLGLRGVRATLAHPNLFSAQLRAILRAADGHDLGVMAPMVTNPQEMEAVRNLLELAHRDLTAARCRHAWPVRLGMMVEVPGAALNIAAFRDLCDFYSVGTNDLTQYVLAADRGNPRLAMFHNAGHPSVLALCRKVCAEGGRPASVCGEAAGDPRITPSLVEAGIRTLSMSPALFGAVRRCLLVGPVTS